MVKIKKQRQGTRTFTFDVDGSPYIGIYALCTESLLLLPAHVSDRLAEELGHVLEVKVIRTYIAEMPLIGCLAAGNSNGLVVSQYTLEREIEHIKSVAKAEGVECKIRRLPVEEKMTAAGNIILTNDSVALVHPGLSEEAIEVIRDTLDVDVYRGEIGGLRTVGMAAVATNRGILAHKDATKAELTYLEEIFRLRVEIGSVNFGVPLIGAALLANTKGYAAGYETTGAELGRIEDALGFEYDNASTGI
ncbi:MAG: translation initiation factor IF-6 [Methanophagales archaeon]|nr:translation initiation factor IF-6 [Methanophagales archaeon]